MQKAIEILMNEHRLIEQALGSLETFVNGPCAKTDACRQTLAKYAQFFRNFADRCHHGKEEDRLFVKMNENGFPMDNGPLAVMLAEHDEGRSHVRALAEIGAGHGLLSQVEQDQAAQSALAFIPLLRAHIQKEDNILYPMAAQALPADEIEELTRSFETFEKDVMGNGEHERLHALANELITAYPPGAVSTTAPAAFSCCSGHV